MELQDIVIKQAQPIRVAQASAGNLTHADIGAAFGRLMPEVIAHIEAAGAKPGISVAVYEDDGGAAPEGEIVLHAGFAIGDQEVPGSGTVRVVNLPTLEVAAAVYGEVTMASWRRGRPSSAGSTTAATALWATAGSTTTSGTTTTRPPTSWSSNNPSLAEESAPLTVRRYLSAR